VVTKLDRLARSLPDARDIVEELTTAEVKLNIGGSMRDPNDPIGRLLFNVAESQWQREITIANIGKRPRLGPYNAAGAGRPRSTGPAKAAAAIRWCSEDPGRRPWWPRCRRPGGG